MSKQSEGDADSQEIQRLRSSAELVGVSEHAADLLREFERDGSLSPSSQASAGFSGMTAMRTTPGYVLLFALGGELSLRMSELGGRVDAVVDTLPLAVEPQLASRLVKLSVGDIGGGQQWDGLTLELAISLLAGIWKQSRRSSDQRRDMLLVAAEAARRSELTFTKGDASWARGNITGPWDIDETTSGAVGWRSKLPEGTIRHDFGSLQVPFDPGLVQWKLVAPAPGVEAEAFAIHLMDGKTVIQLDLFRADPSRPWTQLCSELHQNMIASGGTADLAAGPMGPEVRGTVGAAVSGDSGSQKDVRFLGCQGPGWLLRATVWGAAAAPHSNEPWPYDVCTGTVVNARQGSPEPGAHILLRLPDTYGK